MRSTLTLLLLIISVNTFSQIGIGTTTPEGALDITSTNSGVLVPRVALTSRLTSAPVTNPQTGAIVAGTLIWNTATNGTAPNNVVPGFYYWNGSAWIAITGNTGREWALGGNAITNPATEYIGTTSAQDFNVRTGNTERFTFSNSGTLRSHYLGLAASPAYSFNADPNTGIFSPAGGDLLGFSTNATERFRIPNANQVHAMSLGTAALPFYSFGADTNTGIFSPAGGDVLGFSTTGFERMRIIADGRVAINSVAPFAGDQFSVFGTGSAVNGYTTGANGIGVYGQSTGASGSIGMYGTASGTNAVGQFGVSNNVSGFGVRARNTNAAGTGVLGAGNNIVGTYLIDGTGGSFNGITTALFAYYTTPNVGSGIVIQDAFYQQWDLGAWDGMYYKIIGTGTVSTVVNDLNNDKVVMQCTETPEGLFQDHGIGQLTNGKAHITIDPIFSKNIKVSDEFPLKVFVQLEGECNGVYVTNKSATSFDVVELQGGNSNVKFAYSIVANRADENFVSENGDIRSSVYSTRFKQAPKIRERATLKDEEVSK